MQIQREPDGRPQERGPIRPRGQVRRELIAAGVELARSGGPESVTLREATRLVGVTPNAAYRHFDDRDSLLNEVCIAAMRTLANFMEDELETVTDVRPSDRAKQRFVAIGQGYLRFAREESGLFASAFAVPRHLEYAQDSVAAGRNQLTAFQLLSKAIDDLSDQDWFPEERRPGAEFFVWSGVHGFAVLSHSGPLRESTLPELQQLGGSLLHSLLRGL